MSQNSHTSNDIDEYDSDSNSDFFDQTTDLSSLLQQFFYCDENKKNIVQVGIDIQNALNTQNKILKHIYEQLKNK